MSKLKVFLAIILLSIFTGVTAQENYTEQGKQKLRDRELGEAIALFSQALKENPRDTAALSGIIRAHLLNENTKEAQKHIDLAIKEFPNNPEFHLRRGIMNNLRGQYRRAIDDFNKALELSTSKVDNQIYINRGMAFMQYESYSEAVEDFTEVLNSNPRNSIALNYRAFAHYRSGNFIESINDYNKAIDLNPDNQMSYYNRGMAHLRAGDKAKACTDFHQACSKGNVTACRMIMVECGGR